jgi:predicted metal-dependent enzyme (double-stranded beta helix superfamily)
MSAFAAALRCEAKVVADNLPALRTRSHGSCSMQAAARTRMTPAEATGAIDATMRRLVAHLRERAPLPQRLQRVAAALRHLALQIDPITLSPRRAQSGANVQVELASDPSTGVSLDLVSDPVGSVDAPHEHLTWAVIAGIEGEERHRLYQRRARTRRVEPIGELRVGRGETLVLLEGEIHATEVIGFVPTCHLHLYGRPLSALPPLAQRSFTLA